MKLNHENQWRIQDIRKGGPAFFFFFFFCFSTEGGGGVILQKNNNNKQTIGVFQQCKNLSKHTLRNIRDRGGGRGVLTLKNFKKIGQNRTILNTSDRYFVQ